MGTANERRRPLMQGAREAEVLHATLDLVAAVGYDRLTMDAVAARARASKATLYRHWASKAELVIDALRSVADEPEDCDTGALREDLMAAFRAHWPLTDPRQVAILAGVITAATHNADVATWFKRHFLAPKVSIAARIFERARQRGEIREGADVEMLVELLPGLVLVRAFLTGDRVTPELVGRVIDAVILPAAAREELRFEPGSA